MFKPFKFYLLFLFLFIFILSFIKPIRPNTSTLKVHYIDIGQGDASLIEYNNKVILIDSGPNSSEKKLLKYLTELNIKKINYIFITHPHEDHIGNLDKLILNFKIDTIFMPKLYYDNNDFNNLLSLLKTKKLKISFIEKDFKINLDNNVFIEIFSSPKTFYENINNFSPIIKLTFNNDSFLFTGDNEVLGELEFLDKNLESDILKVGHHGSNTSSSIPFLKKVNPKIAIISCGKNNEFNHPNINALKRISNFTNMIYRTDEDGTIIITSLGNSSIKIEKK